MTSFVNDTPAAGMTDLIGLNAFEELLSNLPDDYFDEPIENQREYWRMVRHEIIYRENQDLLSLANLYRKSYNIQSTVSDEKKDTRQ